MKLIQLRTVHILSLQLQHLALLQFGRSHGSEVPFLKVAYPIYSYTMWGSLAKLVNITPITLITLVYGTYSIL